MSGSLALGRLEARGDVGRHAEVKLVTSVARALHVLTSRDVVACRRTASGAILDEPPGITDNARIMYPLNYNINGRRRLPFNDGVKATREETMMDFPIEGERSLPLRYPYTLEHLGTHDARQTKWATEFKIDCDSVAFNMHDILGTALDLAVTWDQADAYNLASRSARPGVYSE